MNTCRSRRIPSGTSVIVPSASAGGTAVPGSIGQVLQTQKTGSEAQVEVGRIAQGNLRSGGQAGTDEGYLIGETGQGSPEPLARGRVVPTRNATTKGPTDQRTNMVRVIRKVGAPLGGTFPPVALSVIGMLCGQRRPFREKGLALAVDRRWTLPLRTAQGYVYRRFFKRNVNRIDVSST